MKTVRPLVVLPLFLVWVLVGLAHAGTSPKTTPRPKKTTKAGPATGGKAAGEAPSGKKPADAPAAAKTPAPTAPLGPRGASLHADEVSIEIEREPSGRLLLVIRYPWKVHARPSVEVRQIAHEENDTREIRPLQFATQIMKGEVTAAVYQVRERSEDTPTVRKLKYEKQDFELVGTKNRLGRGAVCALFPPDPDAKPPIARVAYPLLDPWALDAQTLVLELPEQHFAEPGWIRVWLLREGNIVWWKTVAWPGRGK